MNDKNKFKIELGEQPKKYIDDILDRKDKKAFYEVTNAIKKIQEDPLNTLAPIIDYNDKDILQTLGSYKGKKINRLTNCKESPFGKDRHSKLDFGIINLEIEDLLISLYDASIFYDSKEISMKSTVEDFTLKSFIEGLKRGFYFNSAVFRDNAYEIRLSDNPPSKEFLIKSDGISISDNIRKK